MYEFPRQVREAEFSLLHFHLEFQECHESTMATFLRLRRELRRAGRLALGSESRFEILFDPPLSADPVARRRFQRPGPPFVLLPSPELTGIFDPGDRLVLTAAFWGRGISMLGDFIQVLRALGSSGIERGAGRFDLAAVEAQDAAGNHFAVWREDRPLRNPAPAILQVGWWLESLSLGRSSLRLEFLTPARLVSAGKPLFRADFRRIFPFVLRRVTSMLHAHCSVEAVEEPGRLLAAAGRVRSLENHLAWEDWRTLSGVEADQDLGGVSGGISLSGEGLEEVLWVLQLGTLMNLGKGAAFGSGKYFLGTKPTHRPESGVISGA